MPRFLPQLLRDYFKAFRAAISCRTYSYNKSDNLSREELRKIVIALFVALIIGISAAMIAGYFALHYGN